MRHFVISPYISIIIRDELSSFNMNISHVSILFHYIRIVKLIRQPLLPPLSILLIPHIEFRRIQTVSLTNEEDQLIRVLVRPLSNEMTCTYLMKYLSRREHW